MVENDQESPSIAKPPAGDVWPVVIGCASFLVCFIGGFVATLIVRHFAIRDLPRAGVFEAMHRDFLAVEYLLGGCGVSFVISVFVAVIAALITWGIRRRTRRCT